MNADRGIPRGFAALHTPAGYARRWLKIEHATPHRDYMRPLYGMHVFGRGCPMKGWFRGLLKVRLLCALLCLMPVLLASGCRTPSNSGGWRCEGVVRYASSSLPAEGVQVEARQEWHPSRRCLFFCLCFAVPRAKFLAATSTDAYGYFSFALPKRERISLSARTPDSTMAAYVRNASFSRTNVLALIPTVFADTNLFPRVQGGRQQK